ncbi:hypothetical protein BRY73_14635 [Ochrobactrum sp. P6BS-III]|nr:hypothetical protein BRY73_14635 [Ochrobactrum sp. P6BS-III]
MLFLSSQIARVSVGRRGPLKGIAESAFFHNMAFREYFTLKFDRKPPAVERSCKNGKRARRDPVFSQLLTT